VVTMFESVSIVGGKSLACRWAGGGGFGNRKTQFQIPAGLRLSTPGQVARPTNRSAEWIKSPRDDGRRADTFPTHNREAHSVLG